MAKKPVDQKWIVTIKVKGAKPDVRVLCGDVIFLRMAEGQTATFTVKKQKLVKNVS